MASTVAYIIVCWNNKDLLKECIETIQAQTYPHKRIIMVDNDSSDDSVAYVQKNFPDVEVLAQDKNYAFAKGNNIGIVHALKDKNVGYIALVNTDATLDSYWTTTLVDFAAKKPRGAAFQTVTLDYYDHGTVDSTHIYVAHNGQATQASWRRPLPAGYDIAPRKVFGCNAAAVVYSRGFIEQQPFDEFFDERMFMYLEDVDIAARATMLGWDNYVVPGARAYHMGSASSGKNPGWSLYMTFRNNSGMLVKNLPLLVLLRMFPKLVRGDIDTIKVLWRTNRRPAIKLVVKGRLIGVAMTPLYLAKRFKLAKHRNIETMDLWRLMHRGF
jgi:GT2 family glycosyltransferase